MAFYTEVKQKAAQKTPNGENILEKEQSLMFHTPSFQTILEKYSHQDRMAFAKKQKYRPME